MRDLALLSCGHYLRLGCDLSTREWLPCPRCPADPPVAAALVRVVHYLPAAVDVPEGALLTTWGGRDD
jgi:hypothetical protein